MSGVSNTVHSQERDLERARAIALDGLVLRTTVGSVVHGLSNPGTDDRDELGVCVEPPEYLLGFQRFEHFVYRTQELALDASLPARTDVAAVDAFLVQTYRQTWA